MKYERLTEKAENGKPYFDGCLHCDLESDCGLCPYWESGLNRLAELEDKIEQGTLIELPCKVGDTCYLVYKGLGDMGRVAYKIKKVKIGNIHYIGNNEFFTEIGEYSSYTVKFGRDIFLTREEAEKRLKELQE